MNKEEPYRKQAEKTKQRIEKLNEPSLEESNLPPRSQIHRNQKKKTKWKIKYPLIRILALFFILLPITIFIIYSYYGTRQSEKVSVPSNKGYETVDFQSSKKTQHKKATENTENQNSNNKKVQNESGESDPNQISVQESQVQGQTEANTTGSQTGPSTDKNNASSSQTTVTTIPKNEKRILYHTVQRKENLTSISRKYYQSNTGVETIKTANHLHSDTIAVGQVLKIPLNN